MVRILLDTPAFLWWLAGDHRLWNSVRLAIASVESEVVVSAASAWEIATKYRPGKLPEAGALANDIRACIVEQDFRELPITSADAERAGRLGGPVRDPFDRRLVAQALEHDLEFVSHELSMGFENGTLLGGLEIGTRHPGSRGGSEATGAGAANASRDWQANSVRSSRRARSVVLALTLSD